MDIQKTTGFTMKEVTELVMWLTMIVGGFFAGLRRLFGDSEKKEDAKAKPKPPPGYLMFNTLRDVLVELRTETRSDYTALHLFHNGSYYTANNTSMQRFSTPVESLKPGQSSIVELYDNKLISHYIDGVTRIISATGSVTLVADEMDEGLFRATMRSSDIDHMVAAKVCWNNQVVGYVAVAYANPAHLGECCFNALVDQNIPIDGKTGKFQYRHCTNSCPDCRLLQEFIPRIELMLSNEMRGIAEWREYKEKIRIQKEGETDEKV